MGKLKKPVIASPLIGLLIVMALVVAVVLPRVDDRRGTRRPVVAPPAAPSGAKTAGAAKRASGIPLDRKTAVRGALHCLKALCETGAAGDSAAETRRLAARLDATPKPFARSLSAVLTGVLSYQTGTAASLPGYPDVPRDLIDRAAAACDARGRRRPGEIVLSFAGDCTFGAVNGDGGPIRFPSVYRREGRPDYPFALVRPWLLNDDLSVVNFECTLTDAAATADKQWHFKGPARYASILSAGSVEAAGLSNNHSHDYLQAGFDDTVRNFHSAHVPVFYQDTPYVTTLQGVQTVLIGDCTVVGENTTRIDGAPMRVLREIRRYKKPGNIVIVVMHWGSERAAVPFPWQQTLARQFIDAGADAVVGHHPHVVQGIELYKGRYIAYSLGNFAFGGNSLAPNPETFLLRLRFRVAGGKTHLMPASLVPCWITSGHARNGAGVLRNDYQPKPVFGPTADRTVDLVLARSARLKQGVKKIAFLRLR